jgi:hypothetical protein
MSKEQIKFQERLNNKKPILQDYSVVFDSPSPIVACEECKRIHFRSITLIKDGNELSLCSAECFNKAMLRSDSYILAKFHNPVATS